jgi:hypothetical protein
MNCKRDIPSDTLRNREGQERHEEDMGDSMAPAEKKKEKM